MNKIKWSVIVAVVGLTTAVLGYWLGMRAQNGSVATAAIELPNRDRPVLYWHDPMVPSQKFDKPGKSPFMDMQLVPVYADEGNDGDVRISAAVKQNLGIRTAKVERKALPEKLEATGNVTFDERMTTVVQARVAGYISRLFVKALFERVKREQPLAEIVAPEWLAAQQEYLALLDAESPSAKSIREAARQRLVVLGVPESSIKALETNRKTSPTTTLFATTDGVVTDLPVREGAALMAGAPVIRINGLSTVWVNAQLPESQAALVARGSTVEAHTTASPGATFKGRVLAVLPNIDLQTRTLTARIEVDNAEEKLAPGMFVSLSFIGTDREPQLVVPSEAVIATGTRSVVIVVRDNEAFEVVAVSVGAESNGMSTILGGLQEGQSIVLSGQFLIDSEASLRSALDRLSGEQVTP